MTERNFKFLALLPGLLLTLTLTAQYSSDSSKLQLDPVTIYYESLGEQSPLYSGREYIHYAPFIKVGHPYFKTTDFAKARIRFEGLLFDDAMLLYDIHKDKLILLHFNNVFRIDLPVEKIPEFWIFDHHFIRLYPDSAMEIEEGFYDKLYEGKLTFFVKRRKLIREERTGTDIIKAIEEKDLFYIKKGEVFYPVRSLSGLLNVLSDKQNQVRQHLKKNGIKFRKGREAAILAAVREYDRLTN